MSDASEKIARRIDQLTAVSVNTAIPLMIIVVDGIVFLKVGDKEQLEWVGKRDKS